MKYLIILLFAFASCGNNGLSESDKATIETNIELHNILMQRQYSFDSLNGIDPDKILTKNYDVQPWADRYLTVEKYIAWCERTKSDPMKYIHMITDSR